MPRGTSPITSKPRLRPSGQAAKAPASSMAISAPGHRGAKNCNPATTARVAAASPSVAQWIAPSWSASDATSPSGPSPSTSSRVTVPSWPVIMKTATPTR